MRSSRREKERGNEKGEKERKVKRWYNGRERREKRKESGGKGVQAIKQTPFWPELFGVLMPICSVDHAPCILCGHGRMNYGSGSYVAGPEQSITKGKGSEKYVKEEKAADQASLSSGFLFI